MIGYSSIGPCQCCCRDSPTFVCSDCHLQNIYSFYNANYLSCDVHRRCVITTLPKSGCCVSCAYKRLSRKAPLCCLCHVESDKYYLINLGNGTFVHCICLKALASYLYVNLDDTYMNEEDWLKEESRVKSDDPKAISGRAFVCQFVNFFWQHYTSKRCYFRQLLSIYINYIKSVPLLQIDNGKQKCCFCNKCDDLLIKCRHPNCMVFCHILCYLKITDGEAFHMFLDQRSVCVFFYCEEHKDKALDDLDSDLVGELESKILHSHQTEDSEHVAQSIVDSIVYKDELKPSIPQTTLHLSSFRNYGHWIGISKEQADLLRFSRKHSFISNSSNPIILSSLPLSECCAICRIELTQAIFPQLYSPICRCAKCKIAVHAFCAHLVKDNINKWVCIHCQNPDAVCSYCGQKNQVLLDLSKYNGTSTCHLGCLLAHEDQECTKEGAVCDVCHESSCVLPCSHDGCTKVGHPHCVEGAVFVDPSGHVVFLCNSHVDDSILYFQKPFSKPSCPLFFEFYKLRNSFSIGTTRIYSNLSHYTTLSRIFSSFLPHESRQEVVNMKKERLPKKVQERTRVAKSHGQMDPAADTTINCNTLWKHVGTIFNKKLLKRDIKQMLRIDPNLVLRIEMDDGTMVDLPPFPDHQHPTEVDPCFIIPRPYGSSPISTHYEREHRRIYNSDLQKELHYSGYKWSHFTKLDNSIPSLIDTNVLDWFDREGFCQGSRFRIATTEDITLLLKINRNNESYNERSIYETAISNPNEYIIVAERIKSRGYRIVGMIHYCFWGYDSKVISAKRNSGTQNVDKGSNLHKVLHLRTLQTVHKKTHPSYFKQFSVGSDYYTDVMLFSLACEHARSNDIGWVFVDSPVDMLPFYRDILGMTVNNDDATEISTPLQLPLSCFSYRQFWNWDRHFKSPLHIYASLCDCKTDKQLTDKILHLRFSEHGDLQLSKLNKSKVVRNKGGNPLCNRLHDIRMDLHFPKKLHYHLSSISVDGSQLFAEKYEINESFIIDDIMVKDRQEHDEVLEELIKLMRELKGVMKENQSILKRIEDQAMSSVVETHRFTAYLYMLTSKYKSYVTNLRSKFFQERKRCCVCNHLVEEQDYVECQGCHCIVHHSCYNLNGVPDYPWYCIVCEDILRYCLHQFSYKENSASKIKLFQSQIAPIRRNIYCCICGLSEGALIRTVINGIYCHLCCALCCDELDISNTGGAPDQSLFQEYYISPSRHIPICNVIEIRKKRERYCCAYCQRYGGAVECTDTGCSLWCHVPCSYYNSWELGSSSKGTLSSVGLASFCSAKPKLFYQRMLPNQKETKHMSQFSDNRCDVLSATWDDLTCLSWPDSTFVIPSLLGNQPLSLVVREVRFNTSEQSNKRIQECTSYLKDMRHYVNSITWKVCNAPKGNQKAKRTAGNMEKESGGYQTNRIKRVKVVSQSAKVSSDSSSRRMKSITRDLSERIIYTYERKYVGANPQVSLPNLSGFYKKTTSIHNLHSALKRVLSSSSFCSIFGESPFDMPPYGDQSFQTYMYHYHRGVNGAVFEQCIKGKFDLVEMLQSPNEDMVCLKQILQALHKPRLRVSTLISIFRCLLISSLYSIFPPHVTVSQMAVKKATCSRSLVMETIHLSQVCHKLFDIALEFNNILAFFSDKVAYSKDRRSPDFFPQCVCLSALDSASHWIVCDECHVGYHPQCLGLQVTSYQDLIQTKFCGYWNLDRGFLCPRCCDGEAYELNHFHKGTVQIKDKLVLKWISIANREERKKKRE